MQTRRRIATVLSRVFRKAIYKTFREDYSLIFQFKIILENIFSGDSGMEQKDIEYFKKLLSSMLEEAQQNGDTTIEELTGNNEVFADPADRATAESDRAFTLRLRDRERRLIRKIRAALQRIDDGVYGVCEECGEDISLARLKARPVTRLCINCKARQEEDEYIRGDQ